MNPRILKALRRWWAAVSQPGTGGLIQPGDWRVHYPEGVRSRYVSHGDALNLIRLYGGTLEWRGDAEVRPMAELAKCFTVRNNGEYGAFYLREGVSGEGERKHHWCELTCNTSFGTVGHYWSSMGGPAAWFLSKIGRDYLIGKLWGMQSEVFDAYKAMDQLRTMVLTDRRSGDLDREEARARWESLEGDASGEFEFRELVDSTDWLHDIMYDGGGSNIGKMENPQAVGFVRELWPEFLKQLQADAAEAAKEPACAT